MFVEDCLLTPCFSSVVCADVQRRRVPRIISGEPSFLFSFLSVFHFVFQSDTHFLRVPFQFTCPPPIVRCLFHIHIRIFTSSFIQWRGCDAMHHYSILRPAAARRPRGCCAAGGRGRVFRARRLRYVYVSTPAPYPQHADRADRADWDSSARGPRACARAAAALHAIRDTQPLGHVSLYPSPCLCRLVCLALSASVYVSARLQGALSCGFGSARLALLLLLLVG